jgi:uncharacterized membrane protein
MGTYGLLLFAHVSAVILWLGSELFAHMLAFRVVRQHDTAALQKLFYDVNAFDHILFPAWLIVLISGVLLVINGSWSFGEPWILLGLSGWGFVTLYGFLCLQPQVNRARAMIEREGGMGPESRAVVLRFFVFWRIETIVLFAIVFGMTTKPRDGPTLSAIAGAVAVASAYLLWRARSFEIADV